MLGIANSRMKDFFDLWTLAGSFEFSGTTLSTAIQATFQRRQTPLPQSPPLALTPEFTADTQKLTQWKAFVRKSKLPTDGIALPQIADVLAEFLMPPTLALIEETEFNKTWSLDGQWRK